MSSYDEAELNGCYSMICSGLTAWHRATGNKTLSRAANALKSIYDGEYHIAGGGCSWRKPDWDFERAQAVATSLGLQAKDPRKIALPLALLLDGRPAEYERLSGRAYRKPDLLQRVNDVDRFGTAEQFHNALRRVTPGNLWESVLDRQVMGDNLEQMIPIAAHIIRVEREGGKPDLEPLRRLCYRSRN
ncbi:hypothetical protein [Bifidobacterium callitrichidarum]|uniref:Uncharacterized protein n=1 Tax=Bifidobacterium callitrichidarum TaxID=2052941 RepID=A0A2U2N8Z9_9BIFI|nr:hypothetical protein [Bifidobacterium callitrichidarum]PWG65583.1 hypothetical protein DF196_06510 [Bifidobacterium callitrichidarum]